MLPREPDPRSPGPKETHRSLGFLFLYLPRSIRSSWCHCPSIAPPLLVHLAPLSVGVVSVFQSPPVSLHDFYINNAKRGKGGGSPELQEIQSSPHGFILLNLSHLNWHSLRGQSLCLLHFISSDQTWTLVNDQVKPEMHWLCLSNRQRGNRCTGPRQNFHSTAASHGDDRDITPLWQLLIYWCWLSVIPSQPAWWILLVGLHCG